MNRPRLGVFKFASCDGCQLTLLDAEDALLDIAEAIHIANFPEASREVIEGPYQLALVEGSVTTADDAERIHEVRAQAEFLVTVGACATSGGIQALRNRADVDEYTSHTYPHPHFISALERSTPIKDHVEVDLELRGCPISKYQLLEVVSAFLNGRRPNLPTFSVCVQCKRRANVCVMVAQGTPCLGPVTRAGCYALCPSYARGCFGCFGPMESPNVRSLASQWESLGVPKRDVVNALWGSFNGYAEAFREAIDGY